MTLATYTVWFTEKTAYRVAVQAHSPLEAARLVKAQWDDEGNENLEPTDTEAVDFAVYDDQDQGHDIDDDELDGEDSGE